MLFPNTLAFIVAQRKESFARETQIKIEKIIMYGVSILTTIRYATRSSITLGCIVYSTLLQLKNSASLISFFASVSLGSVLPHWHCGASTWATGRGEVHWTRNQSEGKLPPPSPATSLRERLNVLVWFTLLSGKRAKGPTAQKASLQWLPLVTVER